MSKNVILFIAIKSYIKLNCCYSRPPPPLLPPPLLLVPDERELPPELLTEDRELLELEEGRETLFD